MGSLPTTTFHLQLRWLPISLPVTLLLHFGAEKCHFSLQQLVLGLFCLLNLLPFMFSNTLRHIQAIRSCLLLLEVLVCRFGQFSVDFSSLWLPKGAHPHVQELFLRLTSIRVTPHSNFQIYIHFFCSLNQ